jgi:ferric-chelate reductase
MRELGHASFGTIAIGDSIKLHTPRLGPVSIVLANLVVVLVLPFYKVDTMDQWKWEDVGYRTGFVAIAQLPLIFLLAGKTNIVGLLTGSSYDRLNWFHRWVSRILWLTATIHMGFWFRSWGRYNYIIVKIKTDLPTQRGLAAWCILTFMVITSLLPMRRLSYEIFVVSHLLTMAGFLAAIWYHAPQEVKIWVWIPIGLVVFDRVCRYLFMAYTNLSIFHRRSTGHKLFGHVASFTPMPGNVTKVSIPAPLISWYPGQHVYFSCHSLLPFQSHPLTIASLPSDKSLDFFIRAEGGGTRKLFSYTSARCPPSLDGSAAATSTTKVVTLDGPYGRMRNLKQFNSIMFIAGGMGATFNMPLMRDIIHGWSNDGDYSLFRPRTVTKRIHFVWVVKEQAYLCWFADQIQQLIHDFDECRSRTPYFGRELEISIYVTCDTELSPEPTTSIPLHWHSHRPRDTTSRPSSSSSSSSEKKPVATELEIQEEKATGCAPDGGCCCTAKVTDINQPSAPCTCRRIIPEPETKDEEITITSPAAAAERSSEQSDSDVKPPNETAAITRLLSGRPDVREIIRSILEKAEGESAVVVCGPRGLNADARRSVVGLSDERAVHKGTGAQGIYLHVEQFGF